MSDKSVSPYVTELVEAVGLVAAPMDLIKAASHFLVRGFDDLTFVGLLSLETS